MSDRHVPPESKDTVHTIDIEESQPSTVSEEYRESNLRRALTCEGNKNNNDRVLK